MRTATLSASALLLALAMLAFGCGGGGGEDGAATEPRPTAPRESGEERGGEASIEDFGSEASGSERTAIEGAYDGYLGAVAEGDHGEACSYLSTTVRRSLRQFAPPRLRRGGCAAILPRVLAPSAPAIAREQANGEIAKIRVEGDHAFVVFEAPGAELYQLAMAREGGEWKSTTVASSVLVPDL